MFKMGYSKVLCISGEFFDNYEKRYDPIPKYMIKVYQYGRINYNMIRAKPIPRAMQEYDRTTTPDLELSIKDFGPIKSGSINLKKINSFYRT